MIVRGPQVNQSVPTIGPGSGGIISLKVVTKLQNGLWQTVLQGKNLTVQSSKQLVPGLIYRGRLLYRKGTPVFQPEKDPVSRTPAQGPGGLPADKHIASILHAAGIPFSNEKIAWIMKQLKNSEKSGKMVRFLSQLFDKKIDPETMKNHPEYEALVHSNWDNEGRFGRGNQGPHDKKHGEQGKKKPDRQDLTGAIKNELKQGLLRHTDGESSFLQLYNHIQSGDDKWLLVPLGIEIDGTVISGTLRLKVGKEQGFPRMSITLRTGDQVYDFILADGNRRKPLMTANIEGRGISGADKRMIQSFSEKLTKLGIKLDDTYNVGVFDGFEKYEVENLNSVDRFI